MLLEIIKITDILEESDTFMIKVNGSSLKFFKTESEAVEALNKIKANNGHEVRTTVYTETI